MERLTKRDAGFINEEFWISAEEPDDETIDNVYLKLREYENAEEDGRLLILPCKVGDTVYYYCKILDEILQYFIEQIVIDYDADSPKGYIIYNAINNDGPYEDIDFDETDIGKTIFLTREAAEQALKEMEE